MVDAIKIFLEYVEIFFVLYLMGYSTFLFLSVAVGSSVLYKQQQMQQIHNELKHDYYIPVSIIIPAFNEEVVIIDTVSSLLKLKYKLYEIIVVDDGSTDNTSQVLIGCFKMHRIERPICKLTQCQPEEFIFQAHVRNVQITLVRKKNGGKADSLNMGINISRYAFFISMDADSVLQEEALANIVRPVLENKNVVACGGMVRIANELTFKGGRIENYRLPKNPLVCMQILEYDRSFLASRILMDQYNGNFIISGAFGLFKKEMVVAVGGYECSTLGEDMELVVKLHVFCRSHNIPYYIKYVPDAICWSQAPENMSDLRMQRKRWYLGLFQSMWKHRQLFLNFRFGIISFISFGYFLLYELLSPYIEFFGLITILIAFSVNLLNVQFMVLFFVFYVMFGVTLSLTVFFTRLYTDKIKLSAPDAIRAIGLCIIENSVLRLIMAWIRMTAFIGYKKKRRYWGKIKRHKIDMIL